MFKVDRNTHWVIIDNINFEWQKTLNWSSHDDNVCIKINWDSETNGQTSDISINNSTITRCLVWIQVWTEWNFSYSVNYVSLSNLRLISAGVNGIDGISIANSASKVNLFNIVWVQAWMLVNGKYVTINDSIMDRSSASSVSIITLSWSASNVVINNVIWNVITNTNGGCIVNNLYSCSEEEFIEMIKSVKEKFLLESVSEDFVWIYRIL